MSKADEAREDAEVMEAPPPTYDASVAVESELYSEHDYHIVEAGPSASHDEKKPLPSSTIAVDEQRPIESAPEFFSNEKSNPDSQAKVPCEEEVRPARPLRPSSIASKIHPNIPLCFTLSWRRALFERNPYFDCPALSIIPTNNQPLPASSPGLPTTSRWQLNYEKKYFGRLHRYCPEQAEGDVPYRQVAEIEYPNFMWRPKVGVKIKLEPHEGEIERRGSRHVSRTDKMMVRQGWWSARYGIDLPVLGGARVEWVNAVPNQDVIADSRPMKVSRAERLGVKPGETHLVTVGEVWEDMKRKYSDESWSPYPVQNLVEEVSGRVLAVYTRARPMQKLAGRLEIMPPQDTLQVGLPEYIEGIVVACAAMVGMKDRMGIMSSLVEAATAGSKDMPSVKMPEMKMPNLKMMWKKRRDSGVDEVEKGEVEVPAEMPPKRNTGGGRSYEEMGDGDCAEKRPGEEAKS